MTWAHLHLALNHVPVVGILLVVLLLAAAVIRRSGELTRASFWLLVVLALITLGVYLTGEPAEELVEGLPGFSEPIVEQHEEAALVATIGMSILGLLAAMGLIRRRAGQDSSGYRKTVLLFGLAVGGLLAWTANLGGQIRHTEIRSQAQATTGDGGEGNNRSPRVVDEKD
jgi:uncharacterized membrane protein